MRGNDRLSAALPAVTAAVVGVVLNLALWFGLQVLLAGGRTVDAYALVVSLAAFVGMMKWKWSVIPVVFGAGVLGMIYKLALPA